MSDVSVSQGEGHVVQEYEVFKNKRNALAFFFFHQPILDKNPSVGPFWFSLKKDSIVAGTEINSVVFKDLMSDILDIAKQRGVIMLVEFENQNPLRCTPCYLTKTF
ncbi:MAG: hypothetical protein KAI61_05350 [Alphaproteobacteria bacterium]|nr:hypothetical protein [Alphaproteobacteria bacterium]MCK5555232.1 hypothetical protein [Alphaproteobacteria bacterium]MCK5658416.1 hypothetical protein [Alphaproteobacteria bacterium]